MTVIVSEKYQVVIPRKVRNDLAIKKGMKMNIIAKGGIAYLIPVKTVSKLKGLVKDFDKKSALRDKKD